MGDVFRWNVKRPKFIPQADMVTHDDSIMVVLASEHDKAVATIANLEKQLEQQHKNLTAAAKQNRLHVNMLAKYNLFLNAIESQALAWILEPIDGHGAMLRNISDMVNRCRNEIGSLGVKSNEN